MGKNLLTVKDLTVNLECSAESQKKLTFLRKSINLPTCNI